MRDHTLITKIKATRLQSQQEIDRCVELRLTSSELMQQSQYLITRSQQLHTRRFPQFAYANPLTAPTQLKTDFITQVNHEFRTPLTVILMATELLKHHCDCASNQKQQQYFQQIQDAIAQLIRLLETALTDIEADL